MNVNEKIAEIRTKAEEGEELTLEERLFMSEVSLSIVGQEIKKLKAKLQGYESRISEVEKGLQIESEQGRGEPQRQVVDSAQRSLFD